MNIKAREQLAEILKKLVTDPEESGLTLCPAGDAKGRQRSQSRGPKALAQPLTGDDED